MCLRRARRLQNLALLNMFQSLAPATAPMIGGALALWFGWRAIFMLLTVIGGVTMLVTIATLPETNRTVGTANAASMFRGYLRLLGSRAFLAYAVAGAATSTSFFGFLSAAPFIFIEQLHRPAGEIGFYFVVPVVGFALGSFLANRLVARIDPLRLMQCSSLVAVAGAALFVGIEMSGHLSLVGVLLPMLVFTTGAGIVGPIALSSAIGVLPGMIGAAAGLYGFGQMGFGALTTVAVGFWHDNPARAASLMLLGAALLGQSRAGPRGPAGQGLACGNDA